MSQAIHCDGPACDTWAMPNTAGRAGFLRLTALPSSKPLDFCSWDCVLRYAATQSPIETVP